MTTGAEISDLTPASMVRTFSRVAPAARARSVARWITGPSARGSENGTPTSSTSAPARSRRLRISADRARSGSPAVTYVINPVRPAARNSANRRSIRDTGALLQDLLHALHVLVAAAREVDQQHRIPPE